MKKRPESNRTKGLRAYVVWVPMPEAEEKDVGVGRQWSHDKKYLDEIESR
jgi:hypothetical protein